MNYNSEMTYARIVQLFRAFFTITELDNYHLGHLLNLKYIEGKISAYLECAYLPEDRDEVRLKAYLEAHELYRSGK